MATMAGWGIWWTWTGTGVPGTTSGWMVYDAQNHRVWVGQYDDNQNLTSQAINFYGVDGVKLATYWVRLEFPTWWTEVWTTKETAVYFGGRRVGTNKNGSNQAFIADRLGSATQALYPYGEDKVTWNPKDQIDFATYTRDSATMLDHADQRYYTNQWGRFLTPDPSTGVDRGNPTTWNKYAYVLNDPVNLIDPEGLRARQGDGTCPQSWYDAGVCGGGGGGGIPGWPGYDPEYPGGPRENYPIESPPAEINPPGDPVGAPWYQQHPCDEGDPTNAKILGFMRSNRSAAEAASANTGLGADFLLAWAAYESGWGISDAATQNNNYYGLKPGGSRVHWAGSDPYSGCSIMGYDCFTSQPQGLAASAMSALSSFGGKYLTAALGAVGAGGSAADIAQAIADAGFNSEYGPGIYGGRVNGTSLLIQARKDCLK